MTILGIDHVPMLGVIIFALTLGLTCSDPDGAANSEREDERGVKRRMSAPSVYGLDL